MVVTVTGTDVTVIPW